MKIASRLQLCVVFFLVTNYDNKYEKSSRQSIIILHLHISKHTTMMTREWCNSSHETIQDCAVLSHHITIIIMLRKLSSTVHVWWGFSFPFRFLSIFLQHRSHFQHPHPRTFFKRENIFRSKSLEYKPTHCHVLTPPRIILAHFHSEISIQTSQLILCTVSFFFFLKSCHYLI